MTERTSQLRYDKSVKILDKTYDSLAVYTEAETLPKILLMKHIDRFL